MAKAVAARLKGDDYQHLFSWWLALELLMPRRTVATVIVEDVNAVSVDDVTLLRGEGAQFADRYHQIKYHVDHRKGYSVDALTKQEGKKSSLLQKWFRSWEILVAARPDRPLEIEIVSNWSWVPGDDLGGFLDGESNGFKEKFFTAPVDTKEWRLRTKLADHVGATLERYDAFSRTLRFHFGFGCWKDMMERTAERMENKGLACDENALIVAVGIVRKWVTEGRQEITKDALEAIITRHKLRRPENAQPAVNVYLTTIKDQKFDIAPDYVLDWGHYFTGDPAIRGHDAVDPADWNGKMLPELQQIESQISSESTSRLVRVRGKARLSAWFALGHMFSDVAGYTIEVDQRGELWRSDANPSADFTLTSTGFDEIALDADGHVVAVGISVSHNAETDIRRYLQHRTEQIEAAFFVRPTRNLDVHCLRHASDAMALADGVKPLIRDFVSHRKAHRVLLFYAGPLSGACFIGHRLNAVCREIQIMEWSNPGYMPSFTLA